MARWSDLAPELMLIVFEYYALAEQAAIIPPHLVEMKSGPKRLTRHTKDFRVGIVPSNNNLSRVDKTFGAIYSTAFRERAQRLEVRDITVFVADFDFDILLHHLIGPYMKTDAGIQKLRNSDIDLTINLSVTKHFRENLIEDRESTSLYRWVESVKDLQRSHGVYLRTSYIWKHAHPDMMGPVNFYLYVYRHQIYGQPAASAPEMQNIYDCWHDWLKQNPGYFSADASAWMDDVPSEEDGESEGGEEDEDTGREHIEWVADWKEDDGSYYEADDEDYDGEEQGVGANLGGGHEISDANSDMSMVDWDDDDFDYDAYLDWRIRNDGDDEDEDGTHENVNGDEEM